MESSVVAVLQWRWSPLGSLKALPSVNGDHCAMRVILLACSASWILLYFTFFSVLC